MEIPTDIVLYIESCYKWDEDRKQEVYLKILELPEGSDINKGWCVRTYENLSIDEGKRDARRVEILRDNEDAVRGTFYDENQASDPADVISGLEEVGGRADDLSPLVRKTLEQHYVKGMTIEDIAALDWVDESVIYKRLQRGRDMLKGETQ